VKEAVRSRLAASIDGARRHLLAQAADGFPEARHVMRFPRQAGFTAEDERQSTDVFSRAVLASVLLDAAEIDDDAAFRDAVRGLARREAEHVAAARLAHRVGGWSSFPGLPELPPDLDSLSAALLLFARAAPERTALCEEPVALALANARPDGSIATWLVSPRDDAADRALMERGVRLYWGDGADVDVCAHFYFALRAHDRDRYGEAVRRGARYVAERQSPEGAWTATWYHGEAYAAVLCVRLLRALGEPSPALARAAGRLLETERPDGGWGMLGPDPQETALALWALAGSGMEIPEAVGERAVCRLVDSQSPEGNWKGSPWIKMDVGRARGGGGPTLSYGSATLATAFCLRTLLLERSR